MIIMYNLNLWQYSRKVNRRLYFWNDFVFIIHTGEKRRVYSISRDLIEIVVIKKIIKTVPFSKTLFNELKVLKIAYAQIFFVHTVGVSKLVLALFYLESNERCLYNIF